MPSASAALAPPVRKPEVRRFLFVVVIWVSALFRCSFLSTNTSRRFRFHRPYCHQ